MFTNASFQSDYPDDDLRNTSALEFATPEQENRKLNENIHLRRFRARTSPTTSIRTVKPAFNRRGSELTGGFQTPLILSSKTTTHVRKFAFKDNAGTDQVVNKDASLSDVAGIRRELKKAFSVEADILDTSSRKDSVDTDVSLTSTSSESIYRSETRNLLESQDSIESQEPSSKQCGRTFEKKFDLTDFSVFTVQQNVHQNYSSSPQLRPDPDDQTVFTLGGHELDTSSKDNFSENSSELMNMQREESMHVRNRGNPESSINFPGIHPEPGFGDIGIQKSGLKSGNSPKNTSLSTSRTTKSMPLKCLAKLTISKAIVSQCRFIESGKFIIATSIDGVLCIWNTQSHKEIYRETFTQCLHDFVYVRERGVSFGVLLIATEEGKIFAMRVSDIESNPKVEKYGEYFGHSPNQVRVLQASSDFSILASGCCFLSHEIMPEREIRLSARGMIRLWDMSTILADSKRQDGRTTDAPPIAYKTQPSIVITRKDMTNCLSHLKSSRPLGVRAIAFSPDNTLIVVGFGLPDDEGVRDVKMLAIVDAKTLQTYFIEQNPLYQINAIQTVASSLNAKKFQFDIIVTSQRELFKLSVLGKEHVRNLALTHYMWRARLGNIGEVDILGGSVAPDLNLVAGGAADRLSFWDLTDGTLLASINAHDDYISRTEFSGDGTMLCSASDDGMVKLWRIPVFKPRF